jgi:SpoVK/Ycf46/Vps4 family AAA+-type ATPase
MSEKIRKAEIKSLDDLIHIVENIDLYPNIPESNRESLLKIKTPLYKLRNIIGMTKVKEQIVFQILYYIQKFDECNNDMIHTCIEGPPGSGKTTLGHLISEIYSNLGILSTNKFMVVKRSDLVAGYLGQTAIKTQKVLDECKGGVLFIDEAYSLGSKENRDSFSKECIDTLNSFLTEQKKDFVCIIAGYKDSLDECFFSMNDGLRRRFPWRYTIDEYTPEELAQIFACQLRQNGYDLDKEISDLKTFLYPFFKKNKDEFKNSGGDTETFFHKCKITHSSRVFFFKRKFRKIITKDDINNAFEIYQKNQSKKESIPFPIHLFT